MVDVADADATETAIKRRLPKRPGVIEYRQTNSFAEAQQLASRAPAPSAPPATERTPSLENLPDFFGPHLAMMALAANHFRDKPIRVLDFGGAFGKYKFYSERFLPGVVFDWSVIELPDLVELGRATFPDISFYSSLGEAGGPFDVAVISGALQFLEDWECVLRHPSISGCKFVGISRTAVGPNTSYFQIVHTASDALLYACHLVPKEGIFEIMGSTHDLRASFNLDHYMGELGIISAPAMIWVRR